jgi:hypothetical protein
MSLPGIPHPLLVQVNGRTWLLFKADFITPDGEFSFYFYAISTEHAAAILADIKETATLGGQIQGVYPA